METKFQTSFIPRKPLPNTAGIAAAVPHRSSAGTSSMFMILAVLVFIASLLSVGGSFAWKQYLLARQETYKADLVIREKQFNLSVISHLKVQSTKISLARRLISNHIPASQIFSVLSIVTSDNIRFTSMGLRASSGIYSPYTLELEGYGRDYATVAFQADVLNKLEALSLNTVIRNPIISDPTLNQNGTVSFALNAEVDLRAATSPGAAAAQSAEGEQTI